MKNLEEFLKELTELSKKHNILIEGCGCCGSPFLLEADEGALIEYSYEGKVHNERELCWEKEEAEKRNSNEGH